MNLIVILSAEEARVRTFAHRYAHISITDPGGQLGCREWPLSDDPNRIALLRVEFFDARGDDPDPWGRADVPERLKLPTEEQVAPIVPFVREWMGQVDGFVVNCAAGISRSAGVAAGISKLLGIDPALCYLPPHNPNPIVRDLILGAIE